MCNLKATNEGAEARVLAWTGIGIGFAELMGASQVQHLLGVPDTCEGRAVLRVLGLREVLTGIGILTENCPSPQLEAGVSARAWGDLLDAVLLGMVSTKTKHPARFAATTAVVLGIGVLDILTLTRLKMR